MRLERDLARADIHSCGSRFGLRARKDETRFRGCVRPVGDQSWVVRNRSALPTTLTEESAIAAAPMTGESRIPNTG